MLTETPCSHYSEAAGTGNVTGLAVRLAPFMAPSLAHEELGSLKRPRLGGGGVWDAERPSLLTTTLSVERGWPGSVYGCQSREPWLVNVRAGIRTPGLGRPPSASAPETEFCSTHNMCLRDHQTSQLFSHRFLPSVCAVPCFFLGWAPWHHVPWQYISIRYIAQSATLTITTFFLISLGTVRSPDALPR